LLGWVWAVFFLLIALRIHGSSIALSAKIWAPADAESHYLAQPILKLLGPSGELLRDPLMARSRIIRSDEFAISTMWSMAQFTHEPRFPVRNTNIGMGQNMLLPAWVPVLHPSSLARPVTWGYMLFGPDAGLAWLWWFPPFFCFSTVFLVFNIIFRGNGRLAAFGAFWFSCSAYMSCWSHFPDYAVGFAALGLLGAHGLIGARTTRAALLAGLATGYAVAGFAIQLYPPWMVPLAYVFGTILVALIIRDRAWQRASGRLVMAGGVVAVLIAAGLLASFIIECWPELQAMAHSAYPGRRRLNGGDCNFARLFGSLYNFTTIRLPMANGMNPSEWSGFFLFYPTVLAAVLVIRRVRRKLDPVAWGLLALGLALILFGKFHIPQWLADITFWSYMQAFRSQLAVGFISITLSTYLLLPDMRPDWPLPRREWLIPAAVALATAGFYFWVGRSLQYQWKVFRPALIPWQIWVGSAGAGVAALLLVLGRVRLFAGFIALALLVTSGDFNPLSVSFASIEQSEMRQAIKKLVDTDKAEGKHSLWIASGGPKEPIIGTVLAAMGGRSLTGVFFHPQHDLWTTLDPQRKWEATYNRYSETNYIQVPNNHRSVKFTLPSPANFNLHVAPGNPILRQAGVRYALTHGKDQFVTEPPFTLLFEASDKSFRIWELPEEDGSMVGRPEPANSVLDVSADSSMAAPTFMVVPTPKAAPTPIQP
jgi:hypothetical protein